MNAIKRFKIDTSELSKREKLVFDKLVSAVELIAPLYLRQKNSRYLGANFYPHNATKKEIEKAAEKNSKILDPYTFVEKDKKGEFIAIPYCVKFKKQLLKICKLLKEAAFFCDDKNLKKYLQLQAKALLNDDYKESNIQWLKIESSKITFSIGPTEAYFDKLFFKKCIYEGWVGILNKKKTSQAEKFKQVILSTKKKVLIGAKKIEPLKMGIRIDKSAVFSGLMADCMFTGTSLPNDLNLTKKYGSMLVIFEGSLKEKFMKDHFPVFKLIFNKKFQKDYKETELYEASLKCILVHEIAHSLIHYQDAVDRLKNLYPIFNELYAYILGIKNCGTLVLKDVLKEKELQEVLIMHICRNFTWWRDSMKNPDVKDYTAGAVIIQNFFLKQGAIIIKNNLLDVDFTKVYICIDEFCRLLEYYLALGDYKEAKEFIKNHGSFNSFQKNFSSLLKKIKKDNN